MNPLRPEQIGWLAGLLEGEGHFYKRSKAAPDGVYVYPGVRLMMTDADVVERAYRLTGLGTFTAASASPSRVRAGHKQVALWSVDRTEEALEVMRAIRPWMGQRRGERIDLLLARVRWGRGSDP